MKKTTPIQGVSAKDEIKNDIISYISRELRSLGDVVVVDSQPNYTISIVALNSRNKANEDIGYAFSVVVTSELTGQYIATLTSDCKSNKNKDLLFTWLATMSGIKSHILVVGSDLRKLCSDLVASTDAEVFEEMRRMYQRRMDSLKKP